MSKRDAPVAIISMAQQAKPKVIGHMLDSRAQLIACSSEVVMTLSSKRPCSQPILVTLLMRGSVFGDRHQLARPARDGVGTQVAAGGPLGGDAAHHGEIAAPP